MQENKCNSGETACLTKGNGTFCSVSQVTSGNFLSRSIYQQSCEAVFIPVDGVLNTSVQNVACFMTVPICPEICVEKLIQ